MAPALMSLRWRQQERVVDSAMRVGGGGGGGNDDGGGNVASLRQVVGRS